MQVIVYYVDGKRCVMTPILQAGQTIEDVAEKDVPEGIEWQVVDDSTLTPELPPLRPLTTTELLYGLLHLNIMPEDVDEVIDLMDEPDKTVAKWKWQRVQTYYRDDPLIEQIAVVFGKTSEEVDAAWRYAMS